MKKYYFLIIVTLILGLVLAGCSLLTNVGQVPATNQSGINYLTKGGPTVDEAESFPLYAGQDWLVGEVLVWNDDNQVCVKYRLFDGTGEDPDDVVGDGWGLTETHLAIGKSLEDIPTNKAGNPKVGNFPFRNEKLGGVAEDGPYCIDFGKEEGELDVECDDELVIAAHAVIEKEDCIPGDSGTDTYVSDTTTMVTEGNVVSAVYPYAAVPTDAGPHYGANTWINATGTGSWVPAPTWIWESNPVVHPILGDIVWFEKTFNVTGTPTAGELKIAVDNGYAVWLNGKFVGSDNLFLFAGADDNYDTTMLGDLKQAYVDTTTWQTVGIFNLTPYLQTGTNTLKILGANEYMNPDDGGQPVGTVLFNPGGMAFQFTVDWEVPEVCTTYDETAWGAVSEGEIEIVEGKSWATYFEYVIGCANCPCITSTNNITEIDGLDDVSPDAYLSDLPVIFSEYAGSDHGGFNLDIVGKTVQIPTSATVESGVPVCSYYVHFDNGGVSSKVAEGYITFDKPVIGLIVAGTYNTNDIFNKAGIYTMYDVNSKFNTGIAYPVQGEAAGLEIYYTNLEDARSQDNVWVVDDTVYFKLSIHDRHDAFRIIVEPEY